MIEVFIQPNLATRYTDVFIIERSLGGSHIIRFGALTGTLNKTALQEGAAIEHPSLRMPSEILEAFAKAINKSVKVQPEATQAHLEDSIKIRDRMLTLVEKMLADDLIKQWNTTLLKERE